MNEDENRKEACKTHIEQAKLLVSLSSGFLIAPAAVIGIIRDSSPADRMRRAITTFTVAEICFIGSVLAGYVVLGSIAGSQEEGEFDMYRPATRYSSLIQLFLYLLGLATFVLMIRKLAQ